MVGQGVFWEFVNWLSVPLLAALAGVLFWRKTFRDFPYFFYYVVAAETVTLTRLAVYYLSRGAYRYTYWISDVLLMLFSFLAAYELFLKRLFPRFHATRFYRHLFPFVAVLLSFLAAPIALQTNHLHTLTVTLRVLDFLRVGILVFFAGLMLLMGRHWTRSELAIASGLAVQAAAMLAAFAIWTKDPRVQVLMSELAPTAYDTACIIWLIAFLRPENSATVSTIPVDREILQEARKWEAALRESVTGKRPPQ